MAAAQGRGESDTAGMGDGFIPWMGLFPAAPCTGQPLRTPPIPAARPGPSRPHPHSPEGRRSAQHPPAAGCSGGCCRGSAPRHKVRVWGRPAWVVSGSGSSPAAHPDHRVIEKRRWPLQRSQSPFSPADCNQHLIHTPLFTNFPGGIMLMKGARQSSSLPEVGKRRGKEESAAAGKKEGNGPGKARRREGRTKWGLLGLLCPTTSPASLPGTAERREMLLPVGQPLQHPWQSWVPLSKMRMLLASSQHCREGSQLLRTFSSTSGEHSAEAGLTGCALQWYLPQEFYKSAVQARAPCR